MDFFYTLALLACPVGMGAMMWFMMKGNSNRQHGNASAPQDTTAGHAGFGSTDPRQQELAALSKEVADLRNQVDKGDDTPHHKELR